MSKFEIRKGSKMGDRELVPIFSKWVAVDINSKHGFPVIGIRENDYKRGEIIYFFDKTDEIIKVLKDEHDITII